MARRTNTNTTPAYTTYNITPPPAGDKVETLRNWIANELTRVDRAIPRRNTTSVTAAYTALPSDGIILADATAGAFTVTLPDPTRVKLMEVTIKRTNAGTNLVTVGGTVDGKANPLLTVQYQSLSVLSTGSAWVVGGQSIDLLGGIDPAMSPDTVPSAYNDEFSNTSLNSKWGWLNQGTSSLAFRQGRLLLTAQESGSTITNSVRLLTQAVPAGSWAMRTRVGFTGDVINCGGGLVAYRSGTGDFLFQSVLSAVSGERLLSAYWTDFTSFGTSVRDDNPPLLQERNLFMQMRYDGTTLYLDHSFNNVQFFNLASVNATTAIGGAPTHFGIAANAPRASTPDPMVFDWFRVYANANLNQVST